MLRNFLSIIALGITFVCNGQTGLYKPFKLVIISTDTAVIDSSLKPYAHTIEQSHLANYYNELKFLKLQAEDTTYPETLMTAEEAKELRQQAETELDYLIKNESQIKEFRYFNLISEYSASVYQLYFNEYPPLSTIQLVKRASLEMKAIAMVADSLRADYVIAYKDIRTEVKKGQLVMKMKTILYSKAEGKILIESESTGDVNSYGDMWTCSDPLSCLLTTSVKSSSETVFDILRKRQHL
jgi:hypothetical protein